MSTPAYLFREATSGDFEFVFELNKINMRKYVETIRGWDEEAEQEEMRKKFVPGVDTIIQINGEDAGIFQIEETKDAITLKHVELLPRFQNKGFGKMIISDLLKKGKPVRLQVLKQNPAVKLYERLGFKIIGETELKYRMST